MQTLQRGLIVTLAALVTLALGISIGRGGWGSGPTVLVEAMPIRSAATTSVTPGRELLDRHVCEAGLIKYVTMLGVEDRLDRSNIETSRMSDAFATFAVHKERYERRGQAHGSRDYDEVGPNKHLFDRVALPQGYANGQIVMGVQLQVGSDRDGLGLYVDEVATAMLERGDDAVERNAAAGIAIVADLQSAYIGPQGYTVLMQDIGAMESPGHTREDGSRRTFADYLDRHLPVTKTGLRPAMNLSLVIGDDTPVDFIGVVSCHEPEVPRGMTWAASDILLADTGLMTMSCNFDLARHYCDPRAGDLPCSDAVPLACYRDGERAAPVNATHQSRINANFTGGDIRLTEPVKGSRFASSAEASQFCRASFGEGWRVLDHHVAGGDLALTVSDLPDGARAWVDIRTSPRATCWGN